MMQMVVWKKGAKFSSLKLWRATRSLMMNTAEEEEEKEECQWWRRLEHTVVFFVCNVRIQTTVS